MNILYTVNSSNPGGMEKHVLDLIVGLKQRGHNVHVVCPSGVVSEWYKTAGAIVVNKNIRIDVDPVFIFWLTRYLRNNAIDVIHSHELKAGVNSMIASNFVSTPVVITHTHTPISEWQINTIKKGFNMFFYSVMVNNYSDMEIALTDTRRQVKIGEGILEAKLTVIPNGVKVEDFVITSEQKGQYRDEIYQRHGINKEAFVIGTVSRLSQEKGIDILIEGFEKFLKTKMGKQMKFHMLIAGGGVLESELRSKVQMLGLSDKATITGVFQDEDKVKLYSALDLFVFPTLAEGFGIVLIEAMASGLPCLCSNLEVLGEVGGGAVRFFEAGNSDNLSQSLVDFVKDGSALGRYRMLSIDRAKSRFSLDTFVKNYEDLYVKLFNELVEVEE